MSKFGSLKNLNLATASEQSENTDLDSVAENRANITHTHRNKVMCPKINPNDPSETIIPKIVDPKMDDTIRPLPYQLAGHITFGAKKIPCIMLSPSGDTVLKLIQPPPKGQNEFIFYRHTKHFLDNYVDVESLQEQELSDKQTEREPTANLKLTPRKTSDSGLSSSTANIKYLTVNLPSSFFDDNSSAGISNSNSISQFSEAQSLEDYCKKITDQGHFQDLSAQVTDINSINNKCPGVVSSNSLYAKERLKNGMQGNLFDSLIIDNSLIKELTTKYIPKFFGTQTINGYDYLELENLGHEYISPCLADVKIGRVTYDPTADETKRARRSKKWPPLFDLGYSFLGIKRDNEKLLDRSFCRSLKLDQILLAFDKFLPKSNKNNKVAKIVDHLTSQIEKIISWFERQNCIQFYASSLLVTYCSESGKANLKMIDFAHVFYEVDKRDENYLFGIRNFQRDLVRAKERVIKGENLV